MKVRSLQEKNKHAGPSPGGILPAERCHRNGHWRAAGLISFLNPPRSPEARP